ncbi:hypothetical protein OPV22_000661 [Ensete ventricosum]|uniref:Uncharacterized protein n=1 Tax=Ensete ventricosum TaxID=4639 RepID=A0AAV8RTD9_ENSVE|nr:hypothetical protein OPV22_000661 [Ensete ventricosum]
MTRRSERSQKNENRVSLSKWIGKGLSRMLDRGDGRGGGEIVRGIEGEEDVKRKESRAYIAVSHDSNVARSLCYIIEHYQDPQNLWSETGNVVGRQLIPSLSRSKKKKSGCNKAEKTLH